MSSTYETLKKGRTGLNLDILSSYIPSNIVEDYKKDHPGRFRERVYGLQQVLNGFLLQAIEKDKTEEHIVNLMYLHHETQRAIIEDLENERKEAYLSKKKEKGRPFKQFVHVQKSKRNSISINTASFNEAKKRFPPELLQRAYEHTTSASFDNRVRPQKTWNGHDVKIVDGTLIKTVDNKELRSYFLPKEQENAPTLPLARVVGLIDYYGGYVSDFRIDNYNVGETILLKSMYATIRPGTVLLCDALYCTYGHFANCLKKGTHLLVPNKKGRNQKDIVETIYSENDCLIRWKRRGAAGWDEDTAESIVVRKITFQNPHFPPTTITLYTSLLDPEVYRAEAIILLYLCRWDIEMSFKEIKIVMQLKITRGLSVDTVKKEIYSHLIVYNILRSEMQSVFAQAGEDFFSLRKTIYEDDTLGAPDGAYVDRRGRSIARKSPGRYPERTHQV